MAESAATLPRSPRQQLAELRLDRSAREALDARVRCSRRSRSGSTPSSSRGSTPSSSHGPRLRGVLEAQRASWRAHAADMASPRHVACDTATPCTAGRRARPAPLSFGRSLTDSERVSAAAAAAAVTPHIEAAPTSDAWPGAPRGIAAAYWRGAAFDATPRPAATAAPLPRSRQPFIDVSELRRRQDVRQRDVVKEVVAHSPRAAPSERAELRRARQCAEAAAAAGAELEASGLMAADMAVDRLLLSTGLSIKRRGG